MARDRTIGHSKVTISNGTSVSNGVKLGAEQLTAIVCPAAWTAGVLAFETSHDDGTTWSQVFDDAGTEVSIASATIVSGHAIVDAGILNKLRGLNLIRLASGPAGARVNQGADRIFELLTKTL